MRILHAISSTDPAGGGPIEGLKQIARAITPLGGDIEVVSLDDPASPWLAQVPLKVHAVGPGKGKFGYSPKMVDWLKEHGREFDVIVINGLWQWNGFAVWLSRKHHRRPYFVFTHGMLDPWFRRTYPLKHLKKQAYWLAGQYAVLKNARAVFYTSEEERHQAQGAFWPFGFVERVVAYGTAGPAVDLETAREKFLEARPELTGKRLLLYLSRIHVKKGCDLLIRAFAKVAGRDPKLHLVMAGPDETEWRPELERMAAEVGVADRISWPGMLTGEQKWGAYASAEAFVLPSHQENFGIVVAEALSCSLPVLISNKINIWREIDADGAGVVEEDDQPGTDLLLDRWLSMDEGSRQGMRTAARQCFMNRFEISKAAECLLGIYSSALDRPARAEGPLKVGVGGTDGKG